MTLFAFAVLLISGFRYMPVTALPPHGFSGCSPNSYVRDTMFEGGPYRIDEFYWNISHLDSLTSLQDPMDVTLVTQFSLDRAEKFQRLAQSWRGPISAALVLNYGESFDTLHSFWANSHWPVLFYCDIHVVWGNEKRNYPVNLARNVVLERVKTKRVFLVDVDFFPHENIREFLDRGDLDEELAWTDNRTLLVLPAFEYPDRKKYKRVFLPESKDQMYKLVKDGDLEIFHQHTCPGCHRPSNYSRWFHPESNSAYKVTYQTLYEPYVIANVADLPPFDERFADYGRNKIQLFYELNLRGFSFAVLPFPFYVIHENHDDSKWRVQFLDPSTNARDRSSELWSEFQRSRKAFHELLPADTRQLLLLEEKISRQVYFQQSLSINHVTESSASAAHETAIQLRSANTLLKQQEINSPFTFSPLPQEKSAFWPAVLLCLPVLFAFAAFAKFSHKYRHGSTFWLMAILCMFYASWVQWWFANAHYSTVIESAPFSVRWTELDPSFLATYSVEGLAAAKQLIARGQPALLVCASKLIKESDSKYLSMPLKSVMQKRLVAPSQNKHDFFSRTFYQQGKDGEMHPDVFSHDYDKVALWDLEAACLHLGLSYYISGDPKYAEKAAALIDHWFLDPNSYMSPHFKFASVNVDVGATQGRQFGLVEAHPFKIIVETIGLIAHSGYWNENRSTHVRNWLSKLALWYQTHEFGRLEERSGNNHQTGYYVMLSWMLTVSGNSALARRLLDSAKYKLLMQISPVRKYFLHEQCPLPLSPKQLILQSGAQQRELKRADAWWYIGYNLMFFTELAMISDRVGIDLWHLEYQGRSLKRALDWVLPYLLGCEDFKFGKHHLTSVDLLKTLFPAFRRAAIYLRDARYEATLQLLAKQHAIETELSSDVLQLLHPKPRFSAAQLSAALADLKCDRLSLLGAGTGLIATKDIGETENSPDATQAVNEGIGLL